MADRERLKCATRSFMRAIVSGNEFINSARRRFFQKYLNLGFHEGVPKVMMCGPIGRVVSM